MCGGTTARLNRVTLAGGLSPRVRGNPPTISKRLGFFRSIPACAGEPNNSPDCSDTVRVYPRVCGGTSSKIHAISPVGGLSPRVRGNPCPALVSSQSIGSIPACAGEPAPCPGHPRPHWVYPRVCGGTDVQCWAQNEDNGLSPRVRGNQPDPASSGSRGGSIPACAGEPSAGPTQAVNKRVYPRVCGGTLPKGKPGWSS